MKCIDNVYQFNYILCGNSSIGKTTLCNKYITGEFHRQTGVTIGVDYQFKWLLLSGKQVKVHIFDTGGQEKYKAITSSYYRSADGVFLCFSLSDLRSFMDLAEHLYNVRQYTRPGTHIILVGTIKDDVSQRTVDSEKIKEFLLTHNLEYIEVSSLTGENVEHCFDMMHAKVESDIDNNKIEVANMSYVDGDNKKKKQESNGCCTFL